jgi:hypothetical protein
MENGQDDKEAGRCQRSAENQDSSLTRCLYLAHLLPFRLLPQVSDEFRENNVKAGEI